MTDDASRAPQGAPSHSDASPPSAAPTPSGADHAGPVVPGTFSDLLDLCPQPYRRSFASSANTDPDERADYEAEILLHAIDIVPILAHEWALLRDIGEMTVEIGRYRRIMAQFLDEGRREVLAPILLEGGMAIAEAGALAAAYVARDAHAIARVDRVLAATGLSRLVVDARAHQRHPGDEISRRIAEIAKRRDRLVRDLHAASGVSRSGQGAP